jgi:hypothetical protein
MKTLEKQDLKQFSDQELSLIVMNDECLYNQRRSILRAYDKNTPSILSDLFEYTENQLNILAQDIRDDLEENSK